MVANDARRQRALFGKTESGDPMLRLQGLLQGQLQPRAAFTTAVSFAQQGQP
jgi:hypothetical protein